MGHERPTGQHPHEPRPRWCPIRGARPARRRRDAGATRSATAPRNPGARAVRLLHRRPARRHLIVTPGAAQRLGVGLFVRSRGVNGFASLRLFFYGWWNMKGGEGKGNTTKYI